ASETPIAGCTGDANCTVGPGDAVSVSINSLGGTQWHISMANASRHWTWGLTLTYASSQSSAEWIYEAPSLIAAPTLVANVGTTTFDPSNGFVIDGASKNIAQGNPVAIQLSAAGLFTEATPSSLDSEGDGFKVCSYATTCPAPGS
ncbi:MAG TPA: G1 family glutamic endopeptidase, partial [Acidimicrobiales bacterium]|nr:G1 family glutamic endopeptidase [Acidimicrobiales bacterium]